MKPTRIYYEKCFNLGNYENEKIGIEIQLEEGEKAADAINKARETIERLQGDQKKKVALQNVLDNPDRHTHTAYENACSQMKEMEENDLPF